MSYIYTVKPFKECIKIAVESDDFVIHSDGSASIHSIGFTNWPEGEVVRTKERQTGSIRTETGLWVPLRCFTETEEKEPVPEFIKNLYAVIKSNCAGVDCRKCPLSLTSPIDCDQLADWLEKRYPEL